MDRSTAAVRLLAGDKEPVRAATTANISLSGLVTIDGVTLEAGNRVLVKDQADATQNGVYTASVGAWRRAPDSATSRMLIAGMKVAVQEGATQAGDVWNLETDRPNVGDDAIEFSFYLGSDILDQINSLADSALARINEVANDLLDSAAAYAGFRLFTSNKTVKDDLSMAYSGTSAVTSGSIITTRLEGSIFVVAASDATDHHLTTAGGVKLYDRGVYASPAVAQTQQVMTRLKRGMNVDIIVVSDSTGVGTDRWPHQLAIMLAADNPTHTVRSRSWDIPTANYAAPITVQTGTGSGILTIWNAAISGSVAFRPLGADLLGMLTPGTLAGRDPDLVLVNYGHNGGDDLERQMGMEAACVGTVGRLLPFTPIIVIGQNPSLVNDAMRNKVRAWQHLSDAAGVGFVNVHAFFEDYATLVEGGVHYIDTVHPTALGSKLWTYCVYRAFIYQPDAARSAGKALLNRGAIASYSSYDDLNTGVVSNVTKAKDTTSGTWDTEGASLKITGDGVSGGSFISFTLVNSNDIKVYRGRWVTGTAFIRVLDGASAALGRVSLYDGVNVQTSTPPTDNSFGGRIVGIPISMKVADTATMIRMDIYAAQGGVPTSESFWIDRINLMDGPLPGDPVAPPASDRGTITVYANAVVIKHPNGDMTVRRKINTGSVAITSAWGSLFVSADITTGSWEEAFLYIDHIDIRVGSGSPTGVLNFGAPNATSSPSFQLWSAVSTSALSYPVTIEGKGRWK